MSDVEVVHQPEQQRYAALLDGEVAGFVAYIPAGQMVVLSHTEVDPSYEGHGIGSALARHALDEVREQGRTVMPLCPFVNAWIHRHPEYGDLVYNAPTSTATD